MGHVIFIGAGPGAADLITLRGARALARADVVLHDALADPALREHAPQARWIDVGKRGFEHSTAQATIDRMLVEMARTHGCVVRLKGGDPSVFGRLEEELQVLAREGIACEVIPGVTAALAAAADALRPLTRRGQGRSVGLATAVTRTGDVHAVRHADTEVFYMAGRQLPHLAERLAEAGWPPGTPCSVVSRAGWPDSLHTVHALERLQEAAAPHEGRPTVVVVGAGAAAIDAPGVASMPKLAGLEQPQESVQTLAP